jgi:ABC-type multidrug transport system ATPase subunit
VTHAPSQEPDNTIAVQRTAQPHKIDPHRPHVPDGQPLIKATNLVMVSKLKQVFAPVTAEFYPGTVTAILGPNGSGKTPFVLSLAGRMKPTDGTLTFGQYQLPRQRNKIMRSAGLGFFNKVNEVEKGVLVRTHIATELNMFDKKINHHAVADYLSRWNLEDIADKRIKDLTAQERIYLGIALGMVNEPLFLGIEDVEIELSYTQSSRIMEHLGHIAHEQNTAITVICLEPGVAKLADNIITMPKINKERSAPMSADIINGKEA